MRLNLCFVVESGTDVRLVEGLASRFHLKVLARRIEGGREISQPTAARFDLSVGSASFAGFARDVLSHLVRQRSRPDVVIVQGYGLAALAANLAGRSRGLAVAMLVCSPTEAYYACRRHDPVGRPFRTAEWWALRLAARANARLAQQYVTLGPYLASVVRGHGTERPVHVVPVYGVDASTYCPTGESRARVRERLGLPRSAALVFFSSRVAPEKDPDTLLTAVHRLREEGRDVRILHRSGGHHELSRRATALGIAGAVIAGDAVPPGPVLADYYRASDICVQASREEGLGFSPLEALACGTPVVAAAVGGLRDTIREGETGWTYPAGDAAALMSALRAALDDTVESARRAGRGRQLVLEQYEQGAAFDRLQQVIEALVSERQGLAAPARPRFRDTTRAVDR